VWKNEAVKRESPAGIQMPMSRLRTESLRIP
jgi:hypothetical protein